MKRRQWLVGAGAGAATGAGLIPAARAAGGGERDCYELRSYEVRIGEQKTALDGFLRDAAVPAWNRQGIEPVGVFETAGGPEMPKVHVLLTHPSLDSLARSADRLEADSTFQKAAEAWLERPATSPGYVRYESTLLEAFPNVPRIEVPDTSQPRIFELRTYESHGERSHAMKVEMFTRLGELEIFRRTGLTPVFFGRTLVGRRLPNFVYMLTFADQAARQKAWGTFVADPAWDKLKNTPGYSDPEILSNLSSLTLRPTAWSQV
jgi:hypothetical protein